MRCLTYVKDNVQNKSTRYSRVLGISNIDFTPADITATGVLPSSVRSEEMSIAVQRKMQIQYWKQILGLSKISTMFPFEKKKKKGLDWEF